MDDYPTEEQLNALKEFTPADGSYASWLREAWGIWWQPDWGVTHIVDRDKAEHFFMSTGGWSGNEDVIEAMQGNFVYWSQTFQAKRTGGHFHFRADAP